MILGILMAVGDTQAVWVIPGMLHNLVNRGDVTCCLSGYFPGGSACSSHS
jgi:hypothetical protein